MKRWRRRLGFLERRRRREAEVFTGLVLGGLSRLEEGKWPAPREASTLVGAPDGKGEPITWSDADQKRLEVLAGQRGLSVAEIVELALQAGLETWGALPSQDATT